MRATGIVRRIDDLGRVVVPKELRRTLRIKEGDPLEIFVNGPEIVLKKYQPFTNIEEYAQDIADSLHDVFSNMMVIADENEIVAVAGEKKKEFLKKKIEEVFPSLAGKEEMIHEPKSIPLTINHEEVETKGYLYVPVYNRNSVVGSIIMVGTKTDIDESAKQSIIIQKKMVEKTLYGLVLG